MHFTMNWGSSLRNFAKMSYLALKFGQNPENYKTIENAHAEFEPALQLALRKLLWHLRPFSHHTFMSIQI